MKRTLEIQVECAERLCGECWAVDETVHARRCRIFWVKLNPYGPPAERCPACLAAEVREGREELIHLVERQAKEIARLKEKARWRDPQKEPPENGAEVLIMFNDGAVEMAYFSHLDSGRGVFYSGGLQFRPEGEEP